MAHLLLVRHAKSKWNATGQWTGWTDIELSEEGVVEAKRAGEALRDIEIHKAYASDLKRATQTLDHIKVTLGKEIETETDPALRERSYGIYTGKNKWEVKEQVGDAEFKKIRRSWDHPIPEGESLKDVYTRVVPYFEKHILPDLKMGKNVLVSAHGNSLRALMKKLDNISDEAICDLEVGTGEIHCYSFDKEGKVTGKEIRAANPDKLKV
ncbi:2,3-bisphosphoglycerate-dependent phosphoglycerate mutase [Candidatus Kaiserbacteria bacterium]|nr:2,3-bisphosphoglycerate-dependent phosphoglycerate mutase [Candidatus Kaiserbacteria bacterium]